MTIEKQQFYSDALFFNHLQNIYQKNTQFWRVTIRFFAVIPKYFVQMEQYCARLNQAYKLLKAACNSAIAASHFEKWF